MLKTEPAVFAVGNEYQIMAPADGASLFWVEIGSRKFFDESNGVLRSECPFHRAIVPMEVLNAAGEYTVVVRRVIDRAPYAPKFAEAEEKTYRFQPLGTDCPRVYVISDAHCLVEEPIEAAEKFGKIDLLILNGDLPDCGLNVDLYTVVYRIAAGVTHGTIPIVMARGNHDLRGPVAERYAECFPSQSGNTYYTFRLGAVWGIVLDCGEDKADDHAEYNGTVCCHAFRERQIDFIRRVIARAENEYNAPGVVWRLVVSHNPFVSRMEPPFDIEQPLYAEWTALLRQMNPHYMICGHLHSWEVHLPHDGWSTNGELCPVLVGGVPKRENSAWYGMGLAFRPDGCHVVHNNNHGEIVLENALPKG